MPIKPTNPIESAWVNLVAAVCILLATMMVFALATISHFQDNGEADIAYERAVFLSSHDCDAHLRLAHTATRNDDSEWKEVEASRNQQHKKLCEDLKERVLAIASVPKIKRQVVKPDKADNDKTPPETLSKNELR